MIRDFAHKGLKKYFESGSKAGIQAKHATKLTMILAILDMADEVTELDLPGFNLHELSGNRKGTWSLIVSRNQRITFRIEEEKEIVDLNFEDYH